MNQEEYSSLEDYNKKIKAIHDSMDVLSGKWKILIIASVNYHKTRRFSDILKDVNGISNKMLSKELSELQKNNMIKRTVLQTKPVTVLYELTQHGRTLRVVIDDFADWGYKHR